MKEMNLFTKDTDEIQIPDAIANRKYKDTFFCKLFREKECLLDLHQTLHEEDYSTKPEDITVITLDSIANSFFGEVYNDLGYIVGNRLIILCEQQSTPNKNMPLRVLIYLGREYEKYIRMNNVDVYNNDLKKIPAPELYVFYTGDREYPEQLLLSDAFEVESDALELKINVIKSADTEHVLGCYFFLVQRVAELAKGGALLEAAVSQAVKESMLLKNKIFHDYMEQNESEVLQMLAEEFTLEDLFVAKVKGAIKTGQEKGREEGEKAGEEKGRKEERVELLFKQLQDGVIDIQTAAKYLNVSVEEVEELLQSVK